MGNVVVDQGDMTSGMLGVVTNDEGATTSGALGKETAQR